MREGNSSEVVGAAAAAAFADARARFRQRAPILSDDIAPVPSVAAKVDRETER
jgi:hypothetical protein